jgi:hypothetical protein
MTSSWQASKVTPWHWSRRRHGELIAFCNSYAEVGLWGFRPCLPVRSRSFAFFRTSRSSLRRKLATSTNDHPRCSESFKKNRSCLLHAAPEWMAIVVLPLSPSKDGSSRRCNLACDLEKSGGKSPNLQRIAPMRFRPLSLVRHRRAFAYDRCAARPALQHRCTRARTLHQQWFAMG